MHEIGRALVVADTHLGAGQGDHLVERLDASELTADVDVVFHAGDIVLFGHSHIPWHETHVATNGHVQHHVNPGSAGQRRRQPQTTAAVLDLGGGDVGVRILPL